MSATDREKLLAHFAQWYDANPNLDIQGLTGAETARTVDQLWNAGGWGRDTEVSLVAPTVRDLEAVYSIADVALEQAPPEEREALWFLPVVAVHLFVEFLDVTGRWAGSDQELARCRALTKARALEVSDADEDEDT